MRVGSVFSGIGGIDLALERSGLRVAWQIENDRAACRVLARHWPGVRRYGDVREVRTSDLDAVDVLAGGFPCQDLSVAGRRAGLAGERSGLFYEFMRLAAGLAPTWILLENVPGLLSSNGGRDMAAVLRALEELGYGWAYRCLDARYFGVPQRRRRVFIVGCTGGRTDRAAQVLFEPEIGAGHPPLRRPAGEGSPAEAANGAGATGRHGGLTVARALTARNGRFEPTTETYVVAHTLTASYASNGGATAGANGGVANVLATALGARRLTPTECERLQGLPDGWTAGEADTTRYRLIGNSVAVPVVEWIGRRLLAVATEHLTQPEEAA